MPKISASIGGCKSRTRHIADMLSSPAMQNSQSLLGTLIPLVIVFGIVLLRVRKMTGLRPVRLKAMWIRPAILAMVAAMVIYSAPPHGALQVLILLAAFGLGALAGWHQGKLMQMQVDPASGALQVKASVLAIAIFFGLILLRMGLRSWLTADGSPLHAYVAVTTDAFLTFFVGLVGAQSAEMFIRGRSLLAAAKA